MLLSMCPNHEDIIDDPPPKNGLSEELSMACCSNLPMNKLAYEGAIRVPIAVPCVCK